jgi:DNA-directed RNA polymerase specialized sigma24 family protein
MSPPPINRRGFRVLTSDRELIETMTPEHQAVLRARGNYKKICEDLAIPAGTLKSRLSRARDALELKRITAKVNADG